MAVTNPYVKRAWVDRDVEFKNRRLVTPASGGQPQDVYWARNEGVVYEEGDEWNKANMDDMEQRIYDAITKLATQINTDINNVAASVTAVNNRVDALTTRVAALESWRTTATNQISTAQTTANNALTRANASVLRAGDTMTGMLQFSTGLRLGMSKNGPAGNGTGIDAGGGILNIEDIGIMRGKSTTGNWNIYMGADSNAWLDFQVSGTGALLRSGATDAVWKTWQAGAFDVVTNTRNALTTAEQVIDDVTYYASDAQTLLEQTNQQIEELTARIDEITGEAS